MECWRIGDDADVWREVRGGTTQWSPVGGGLMVGGLECWRCGSDSTTCGLVLVRVLMGYNLGFILGNVCLHLYFPFFNLFIKKVGARVLVPGFWCHAQARA